MGISGLTDRNKTFMRLARVKKGDVVPTADKKSTKPVDLEYFRLTYSDGCEDVRTAFENLYGLKPVSIDMRLPFAQINECWDAFYTCYGKGGKMASASSYTDEDGKEVLSWDYYRDYATAEVWVRNGHAVGPDGERFMQQPIQLSNPVYSYRNDKGENIDVFLKPEGRLNFVVPGLAYINGKPRVGYFEFCPLSPRDIGTISGELAAIAFMAQQVGKEITGIPMKLIRRKENVTVRIKDKLSKKDSWVVHIEVGGEWGGKALTVLETLSLPGPAPIYDIEDEDLVEGQQEEIGEKASSSAPVVVTSAATRVPDDEWEPPAEFGNAPEVTPAPKPAAKPKVSPVGTVAHETTGEVPLTRPYSPAVFKQKVNDLVSAMPAVYEKAGTSLTVGKDDGKILASIIDAIFGGIKGEGRHVVCSWLIGKGSTKEMDPAQIKALFHIMGIKGEPRYESAPSVESITEFRHAFEYIQSESAGVKE